MIKYFSELRERNMSLAKKLREAWEEKENGEEEKEEWDENDVEKSMRYIEEYKVSTHADKERIGFKTLVKGGCRSVGELEENSIKIAEAKIKDTTRNLFMKYKKDQAELREQFYQRSLESQRLRKKKHLDPLFTVEDVYGQQQQQDSLIPSLISAAATSKKSIQLAKLALKYNLKLDKNKVM